MRGTLARGWCCLESSSRVSPPPGPGCSPTALAALGHTRSSRLRWDAETIRVSHTEAVPPGVLVASIQFLTSVGSSADGNVMRPSDFMTTDRAAQFRTLASYWAKRGDLARAALARRNARLHGQTAQLERETGEGQTRGNKNAAPPV
jgi:hypothetical protein